MGKILVITGIVYLLYYTGNVVYDLFIKKPPIARNENEGELISLETIMDDDKTDIQTINEEDVEEVNTPGSFLIEDEEALFSDREDSALTKDRFAEEQEIDHYNAEMQKPGPEEKEHQNSFLSRLVSAISINEKELPSKKTEVISEEMFRNFFEKASSHIVVGNTNGGNFYKSSLVF